jgi:hypothetical protein
MHAAGSVKLAVMHAVQAATHDSSCSEAAAMCLGLPWDFQS